MTFFMCENHNTCTWRYCEFDGNFTQYHGISEICQDIGHVFLQNLFVQFLDNFFFAAYMQTVYFWAYFRGTQVIWLHANY